MMNGSMYIAGNWWLRRGVVNDDVARVEKQEREAKQSGDKA